MCDSDDFRSRCETRNQTISAVETIAGASEVDRSIAKLVLAFGLIQSRDGCMTTRMIICCTSLDCSELGKSSFEGGGAQRTNEGHGVALWLRPGVRGDDGPLEVILAESIAGEKLVDVGSVFEMTEHYRPTGPHWYLSLIDVEMLHRNRGCGGYSVAARPSQMRREHRPVYLWSSNPQNTSFIAGMASRSWIRSRSARRLPFFRCCVSRAEGEREAQAPLPPCRPMAGYGCND
jgi:hypothetical protein